MSPGPLNFARWWLRFLSPQSITLGSCYPSVPRILRWLVHSWIISALDIIKEGVGWIYVDECRITTGETWSREIESSRSTSDGEFIHYLSGNQLPTKDLVSRIQLFHSAHGPSGLPIKLMHFSRKIYFYITYDSYSKQTIFLYTAFIYRSL